MPASQRHSVQKETWMFSQTTEYALRAMACLALYPDQLVATGTLAQKTKVPSNYLAKVLQQLGGAGFIEGRRGVGGGYKLARSASEINLVQIINSVGRLKRIESCPLGLENHGTRLCPLHRTMDHATAMIIDMLKDVSLKDLLGDEQNPTKPLCDRQTMATLSVHGGPAKN